LLPHDTRSSQEGQVRLSWRRCADRQRSKETDMAAAYSHDYLLQEWRAKFDGLDIHARRCADPADWRASHRK
jgi:hypothetical protein